MKQPLAEDCELNGAFAVIYLTNISVRSVPTATLPMNTHTLGVALLVLLSVVAGAATARFDLVTDTTMIGVLLVGVVAMIVVVHQQRSTAN